MELNRDYFPSIIFYKFRLRLAQQQCIDELHSIFGVVSRYGEFNRDRSSLQDEFRVGRQNQLLFRKPLMLYAN